MNDRSKLLAAGGLALAAFAWGWAKNRSMAKRQFAGTAMATRLDERVRLLQPQALASALIMGPFVEEWAFRGQLQGALSGLGIPVPAAAAVAAAAFGAAHRTPADRGRNHLDSPSRAVDAALGGLLYSGAFAAAGLPGAVIAHGAHNLGATFGWLKGLEQAPAR